MADPLLQAQRQGLVLRRLLRAHTEELLDKFALGLVQGTFTYMAVDAFAAISDNGTITRARNDQAPHALKADAIPPALERLVATYRSDNSLLISDLRNFKNAPRDFNDRELLRIAHFLRTRDKPLGRSEPQEAAFEERLGATPRPRGKAPTSGGEEHRSPEEGSPASSKVNSTRLRCKECGSIELVAKRGRYGPYGVCTPCGKNTAARARCAGCGAAVQLDDSPGGFLGHCEECGERAQILVGTSGSNPQAH